MNNIWQETEMKYGFEIGTKNKIYYILILVVLIIGSLTLYFIFKKNKNQ